MADFSVAHTGARGAGGAGYLTGALWPVFDSRFGPCFSRFGPCLTRFLGTFGLMLWTFYRSCGRTCTRRRAQPRRDYWRRRRDPVRERSAMSRRSRHGTLCSLVVVIFALLKPTFCPGLAKLLPTFALCCPLFAQAGGERHDLRAADRLKALYRPPQASV